MQPSIAAQLSQVAGQMIGIGALGVALTALLEPTVPAVQPCNFYDCSAVATSICNFGFCSDPGLADCLFGSCKVAAPDAGSPALHRPVNP
ncbi:hypothetical protein [Thermoleptolyngbya sp.]